MQGKDLGALIAQIGADLKQWDKAHKKIISDLSSMEKAGSNAMVRLSASMDRAGQSMERVGGQMTKYLTLPLAGFGALSLKTAGDFQLSMNRVRALSGATGDQLQELEKIARELGATTQFMASDAADAMGFLAMAGMEVNDIMRAMPDTLTLAASAQLDMASAADIVTNILAGYNMGVSELTRATDVLVKSFTSANTDLRQLAEAMKYAGPIAQAAGVQFEEAAAAMSLMGNAGIQGSMAGTSLRGALSRILSPTKAVRKAMQEAGLSFTDAAGRLLPLSDIIEQLEPHADNAGLFMQLFGQRAGPAMAALVTQGAEAVRKLTWELENSGGTAKRVADVQMEGFNGALRRLKSAFEELQLAIANSGLLDSGTAFLETVTDIITKISQLNPELLRQATIYGSLALAMGPVLVLGGKMTSMAAGMVLQMGRLTTTLMGLLRVLFTIMAPLGLKIAALAALVLIGKSIWDTFEPLRNFFINLWNGIATTFQKAINFIIRAWNRVKEVMAQVVPGITATVVESVEWMNEQTEGKLGEFANNVEKNFNAALDFVRDFTSGAVEGVQTFINSLFTLDTKVEESTDSIQRWSGGIGMAALPAKDYADRVERISEGLQKQRVGLEETISGWQEFWDKFQEIGGDMEAFLAGRITDAVLSFGDAFGRALSGAENAWQTTFEKIVMVMLDFASTLARLAAAVGGVMLFLPGWQGKGVALLAAAAVLQGVASGIQAGINKRAENRQIRHQSVNDAIIAPNGNIITTHPEDYLIATKNPGALIGSGGGQVIENVIMLDGNVIYRNQKQVSHKKGR